MDARSSARPSNESRRMPHVGNVKVGSSVLRTFLGLALVAAVVLAGGCASSGETARALNPDPPEKMFADADALQTKGKFEEAAKKFEDVDREHPYSPEARRAI